jgi:peptidoglycan hydrolase-like protein with peptidoglycan-binding domain
MKKNKSLASLSFLFLLAVFFTPLISSAAEKCTFTKDLQLGSTNEEVRCLQKYLNSSGYTIATSGVGSPGNETNLLRDLTKKAIIKWQTANGLSATGYFGPQSRSKYNALLNSTGSTTTTTPATNASSNASVTALNQEIASLKSQITTLKASGSSSVQDNEARNQIKLIYYI